MDLLRFRRKIKQHASSNAANVSTANGTPTPSPIFSRLVRPASLEAGATGSAVGFKVADELAEEDADVDTVVSEDNDNDDEEVASVVESSEEVPEEDTKLEVSLKALLEDAVGVEIVLKLSDPDIAEDGTALVDNDLDIDESTFEAVSEGNAVGDAVTSVGNASLAGGAAVAGPNSCMK
ncbi:hypothetical protein J4E86_005533 [Alternaria arbusti]|uniref:uncharacterized protein n=1 Tax=Alternaria arbusti TaxID=232088 RepID=UPI00221EA13E|nr:uncharacterized protein J4E86_005533 [Alternaria arbusti]KAI4957061.1 hypothetical protein J4E86_005533 [Alternaria arbusti]